MRTPGIGKCALSIFSSQESLVAKRRKGNNGPDDRQQAV